MPNMTMISCDMTLCVIKQINLHHGNITPMPTASHASASPGAPAGDQRQEMFTQEKINIIGSDLLWKVALTAEDEGVATRATDHLVFYAYRLAPHARIADLIPGKHKELMERCMLTLQEARDDAARVRCLSVCRECARLAMEEARNRGLLKGPAQPHGLLGLGTPIKVYFTVNAPMGKLKYR